MEFYNSSITVLIAYLTNVNVDSVITIVESDYQLSTRNPFDTANRVDCAWNILD